MLLKKTLKKHARCNAIIEDFEDSGLSKQVFCCTRGIPRASFDYYLSLYYQLDAEDDEHLQKTAQHWLFPEQLPSHLRLSQELNNLPSISFIPVICTDALTSKKWGERS